MNSKLSSDGWELIPAEDRNGAHPDTFQIPAREKRETLAAGDGAKLLFDIESRENGRVIDRGVDRMWVIVKARIEGGYVGVLDNDPGNAENVHLHEGDVIAFGPEHIADISTPPREYMIEKYGASFFDEQRQIANPPFPEISQITLPVGSWAVNRLTGSYKFPTSVLPTISYLLAFLCSSPAGWSCRR
jgi:hypothetical protein